MDEDDRGGSEGGGVMDDLVTWLRAQFDEDERVAREATPDNGTGNWVAKDHEGFLHQAVADVNGLRMATGSHRFNAHGARHDPARVLAEVEAKRRILDGHPFERGIVGGVCGTCHGAGRIEVYWDGEEETREYVDTEMVWPCPTVRLLVLPYAGQPGFSEEWRVA